MCLRGGECKPVQRKDACGQRKQARLPYGKDRRTNLALRNVTTSHMCNLVMPHNALPSANRTSLRRRLDHVGIGLAGVCALHCLVTLVMISALGLGGLGGHFLLDDNIHRIGLALALAVGAVAIGWGLLRHRRMLPFAVAMAGLALMAGALVVPHGTNELLLTLVGVTLVSIGHFLNLRAAH